MVRTVVAALLGLAVVFGASARADSYYLEYEGRAYGLFGLGRVALTIDLGPERYTASVALRSAGLLSLFERTTLNATSVGVISSGVPRSISYVLDHAYSAKRRQIRMSWRSDGVEAVIEPSYRLWGDPPASAQQQLASRDPLASFLAMGAAVGQSRRCAGAFPTFDGRFHYRLELSGGRVTRFDEGGFEGQVLRCGLTYVPIAGFEADDGGGEGRIPRGEMWFALLEGDGFAPPVRVSSPLPLGEVAIVLRRLRRGTLTIEDPNS
jgi:Protein of unknown function (DUF3108)